MSKKNQNTFEKRRRDMEKKLRAEDKRKKRQKRKDGIDSTSSPNAASSNGEVSANVPNDSPGA
jgi:hypothetical protein